MVIFAKYKQIRKSEREHKTKAIFSKEKDHKTVTETSFHSKLFRSSNCWTLDLSVISPILLKRPSTRYCSCLFRCLGDRADSKSLMSAVNSVTILMNWIGRFRDFRVVFSRLQVHYFLVNLRELWAVTFLFFYLSWHISEAVALHFDCVFEIVVTIWQR